MAAPRITKEDLKQRLDSPTPPVLVDARLKYPYEHSTVRLPGAADTFRWAASPVGWLTTAVLGIGAVVFLVRMRVAERSWEPESLVGSPIVPSR